MKILASILDSILWMTFTYYAVTVDNWRKDENIIAAIAFGFLLCINLIAIWHNRIVTSDTWIGLYIQRKKAEERAKLKNIS